MAAKPKYQNTAGLQLFFGDEGEEVQDTPLAGIRKWTEIPGVDVEEFETTEVDAMDGEDADMAKYFEPNKADPGSLAFTLSFNEDHIDTVYTLRGVQKSWKILFKSGARLVFNGFIKKIGTEAQEKADILVPVTIRASGRVRFYKAGT